MRKKTGGLIASQMAAQRKSLVLLAISSLVLGGAIVGQAALTSELVNRIFVQSASFSAVVSLLGALLAAMAVRTLLSYGNGRMGLSMAASAKQTMRGAVLRKLAGASLLVSLGGQTGGKVSVALDAVDEVDSYFSQYLPRMIETAVIPWLILIAVFAQHINSGLIMLVTAPFIPLFMVLVGLKTKKKSEEKFSELAAFSGAFLDAVQGLTTLKLFGRVQRQQQEIERSSLGFRDATMGILRIAFTNSFMLELVVMLSIGIIALELAFQLLIYKSLSFSTAFFILLLVPEFYNLLKNMGTAFHSGHTSMGAAQKVESELEQLGGRHTGRHTSPAMVEPASDASSVEARPTVGAHGQPAGGSPAHAVSTSESPATAQPAVKLPAGTPPAGEPANGQPAGSPAQSVPTKDTPAHAVPTGAQPPLIALKDVRFQYAPGAFELAVGELAIMRGEQIAIVGKSGSGKTTLLHLIAGLLHPASGELLVNGSPLGQTGEQLDESAWLSQISYITQHPYIFAGTLAENIAIGGGRADGRRSGHTGKGDGVSQAAIRQAAEAAGLAAMIDELQHGYDTPVGEGGRGLSGGEKQRLALARAFLKQPSVILFDEPTVGLDLRTERMLQRSIAELARQATMITVAHRLYTIKQADRILYMEAGRLLDSGTHEELLSRLPQYAEMVEAQREGGARWAN